MDISLKNIFLPVYSYTPQLASFEHFSFQK